MFVVGNPTRFTDAIRSSHTRTTTAVHRNVFSGVVTSLSVVDGQIVDDATANVRRQLTLQLPNEQATFDALDTVGGEITVTQSIKYVDGTHEPVPMGVFILDADHMGYGPSGTLEITAAPDRWGKVQKNKLPLGSRSSVPGNAAWQEVKRLIEGAWTGSYTFPGWASVDTTATTKVGPLVWDHGDRETAILDICKANSIEVFFDRNGLGVLRPVPLFQDTAPFVWTVDAGSNGVLLDADRTRDRSKVVNVIIVTTSASDVTFPPVEVKNTTVGDPLSVNGPLGYMAAEYSSPLLRNSTQGRQAGLTLLNKGLGVAKQLTLTEVGNPALDSEDVVLAVLPQIDRNTQRPKEKHMLDSVTHPLAPAGTQVLTTRSTRPTSDGI